MDNQERIHQIMHERRMSLGIDNDGNYLRGLDKLIEKINKPDMSIIEIGSYEGATSELFLLFLYHDPASPHNPLLVCVDPWDTGNNPLQEDKVDLARAEKMFDERMAKYEGGWLRKIKMKSEDAAGLFENNSVDLVYIDGDHRYESVKRDIRLYLPTIKEDGFISGHDYCDVVKQAINELLGEPEVFQDSSWLFAKKDLSPDVYERIKQDRINQLLQRENNKNMYELIQKYVKPDFAITLIGDTYSEIFQMTRMHDLLNNQLNPSLTVITDKDFSLGFESQDLLFIESDIIRNIKLYESEVKQSGYITCVGSEDIRKVFGNPLEIIGDVWVYPKHNLIKTEYNPVEVYDYIYDHDPNYGSANPDRDKYIDDYIRQFNNKSQLLDVGCGQGYNIMRLKDYTIIGLEFSEVCVDKYLVKLGWPVLLGSIIDYSKSGECYDGIICMDVMEHIPENQIDVNLVALKKLGKSILFGIANHSDIYYGYELHLTQKPLSWWERKLKEFFIDVKFIDVHNSFYYVYEVK